MGMSTERLAWPMPVGVTGWGMNSGFDIDRKRQNCYGILAMDVVLFINCYEENKALRCPVLEFGDNREVRCEAGAAPQP